jgi:hypothetical protein
MGSLLACHLVTSASKRLRPPIRPFMPYTGNRLPRAGPAAHGFGRGASTYEIVPPPRSASDRLDQRRIRLHRVARREGCPGLVEQLPRNGLGSGRFRRSRALMGGELSLHLVPSLPERWLTVSRRNGPNSMTGATRIGPNRYRAVTPGSNSPPRFRSIRGPVIQVGPPTTEWSPI